MAQNDKSKEAFRKYRNKVLKDAGKTVAGQVGDLGKSAFSTVASEQELVKGIKNAKEVADLTAAATFLLTDAGRKYNGRLVAARNRIERTKYHLHVFKGEDQHLGKHGGDGIGKIHEYKMVHKGINRDAAASMRADVTLKLGEQATGITLSTAERNFLLSKIRQGKISLSDEFLKQDTFDRLDKVLKAGRSQYKVLNEYKRSEMKSEMQRLRSNGTGSGSEYETLINFCGQKKTLKRASKLDKMDQKATRKLRGKLISMARRNADEDDTIRGITSASDRVKDAKKVAKIGKKGIKITWKATKATVIRPTYKAYLKRHGYYDSSHVKNEMKRLRSEIRQMKKESARRADIIAKRKALRNVKATEFAKASKTAYQSSKIGQKVVTVKTKAYDAAHGQAYAKGKQVAQKASETAKKTTAQAAKKSAEFTREASKKAMEYSAKLAKNAAKASKVAIQALIKFFASPAGWITIGISLVLTIMILIISCCGTVVALSRKIIFTDDISSYIELLNALEDDYEKGLSKEIKKANKSEKKGKISEVVVQYSNNTSLDNTREIISCAAVYFQQDLPSVLGYGKEYIFSYLTYLFNISHNITTDFTDYDCDGCEFYYCEDGCYFYYCDGCEKEYDYYFTYCTDLTTCSRLYTKEDGSQMCLGHSHWYSYWDCLEGHWTCIDGHWRCTGHLRETITVSVATFDEDANSSVASNLPATTIFDVDDYYFDTGIDTDPDKTTNTTMQTIKSFIVQTVSLGQSNSYCYWDNFHTDPDYAHLDARTYWEGWTADNREWAVELYEQDWSELYGHTEKLVDKVMTEVVSEENLAAWLVEYGLVQYKANGSIVSYDQLDFNGTYSISYLEDIARVYICKQALASVGRIEYHSNYLAPSWRWSDQVTSNPNRMYYAGVASTGLHRFEQTTESMNPVSFATQTIMSGVWTLHQEGTWITNSMFDLLKSYLENSVKVSDFRGVVTEIDIDDLEPGDVGMINGINTTAANDPGSPVGIFIGRDGDKDVWVFMSEEREIIVLQKFSRTNVQSGIFTRFYTIF